MNPPDDTRSINDIQDTVAHCAAEVATVHDAGTGRVIPFPGMPGPRAAATESGHPASHWERTLHEVKARLRAAASEHCEPGSDTGRSADTTLSRLQAETLDCVIVLNHLHLRIVLEFRRLKRTERELLGAQAALAAALTALRSSGKRPR